MSDSIVMAAKAGIEMGRQACIEALQRAGRVEGAMPPDWRECVQILQAITINVPTVVPRISQRKTMMERCPARSPGGVTNTGTLPRKGTQCGLEKGHDGDHGVLIPTGYPWSRA